jgi:nitrate/nitrite transport system substrate-binding protein
LFFVFLFFGINAMTDLLKSSLTRRTVLQAASVGAVGISPALRAAAYAQGSDAPEKKEVRIGFIR